MKKNSGETKYRTVAVNDTTEQKWIFGESYVSEDNDKIIIQTKKKTIIFNFNNVVSIELEEDY